MVMLNHLAEQLRLADGTAHRDRRPRTRRRHGRRCDGARLPDASSASRPACRSGATRSTASSIEKRVLHAAQQNTVHVTLPAARRRRAGAARAAAARCTSARTKRRSASRSAAPYAFTRVGDRYEIVAGEPSCRRCACCCTATTRRSPLDGRAARATSLYRSKQSRGYECARRAVEPGLLPARRCAPDAAVTLVASTEAWETIGALDAGRRARRRARAPPPADRAGGARRRASGVGAELVLAADQFVITPAGRIEDAARARAAGDEVRTVIAGYHWFTDWGRDTMISLEGLTLATGRHARGGLHPAHLRALRARRPDPEHVPRGREARACITPPTRRSGSSTRSTATSRVTGDRDDAAACCCRCCSDIVEHHLRGTRFGIGVDPHDGLLRQGAEGYQLTWMDAKVGDWVVTPRRGKAVEINALWYNALRLLEGWLRDDGRRRRPPSIAAHAERAQRLVQPRASGTPRAATSTTSSTASSGDDPACRPNQLFAISLTHPVLDARALGSRCSTSVRERLLTPVGLRSLAPGDPDYKPRYYGDLRARDAAYHQGTVWALADRPVRRRLAEGASRTTRRARAAASTGSSRTSTKPCIGSISEIFDAEPPFTPRGCIAQAWSVAEVLRVWVALRSRQDREAGPLPPSSPKWHRACDSNGRRRHGSGRSRTKAGSVLGDIMPKKTDHHQRRGAAGLPADEEITAWTVARSTATATTPDRAMSLKG